MQMETIDNNTPYLSASDLERIAYQTLKGYDDTLLERPQPLNIDRFAERHLKLHLDYVNLSNNDSILGMMVFSDSAIPVFDPELNAPKIIQAKAGTALIERSLMDNNKKTRARFTIAHECAHWLLHRPAIRTKSIVCRTVGRSAVKDWPEWQADALASALLMPAVAVQAYMKHYISENRQSMIAMYDMYGERYAIAKRDQIIRIVSYVFDVSKQAAESRLIRLRFLQKKEPPLAPMSSMAAGARIPIPGMVYDEDNPFII